MAQRNSALLGISLGLALLGAAASSYPISRGKGSVEAETQDSFRAQATHAIQDLLPKAGENQKKLESVLALLAKGQIENVHCSAVRTEPFTDRKKKSGNYEFLWPWKELYRESSGPPTGARCYREYFEPEVGDGFAIYESKVGGRFVLLAVWLVPEAI